MRHDFSPSQQMSRCLLLAALCLAFPALYASLPPKMEDFRLTPSGISYIIFGHASDCVKPAPGDVIWMQLEKKSPNNEIIFSTRQDPFFADGVEIRMKPPQFNGDIMEAFTLLCPGDSAVIQIPVDSVDRDTPVMTKKSKSKKKSEQYYTYFIRLLRMQSPEAYLKALETEKLSRRLEDSTSILEYMTFHHYEPFEKDEHGLAWHIALQQEGRPKLVPGDSVAVHYMLKLLDGTLIDDSYERNDPFRLVIGNGSVIAGWDIGLQYFAPAEKGVLAIPSELGYGRHGSGVAIPPNAVLIFEIEIVEKY
jgi:FKBP-type peptidyl-prolyl cis-trans isomerase FkpA